MARTATGGGGGSATWTPLGITTAGAGGIPIGTNLGVVDISVNDTLQQIFYPYLPPSFASFNFSQTSPVEVGVTLSGLKSFTWSFNTPANVQPNTMDIYDVTAATYLATNISTTSPSSQNIGTVQLTSPGSYSWRGYADNTQLNQFQSANFTVSWQWRRYSGTAATVTLDETGIEALSLSQLSTTFAQTRVFPAGAPPNYCYFAWPDSFGSPIATNGFFISPFPAAMATVADDPFYSNLQNGWYYGLVSVTNAFGQTTNYRVYRTKNSLAGGATILVQ